MAYVKLGHSVASHVKTIQKNNKIKTLQNSTGLWRRGRRSGGYDRLGVIGVRVHWLDSVVGFWQRLAVGNLVVVGVAVGWGGHTWVK